MLQVSTINRGATQVGQQVVVLPFPIEKHWRIPMMHVMGAAPSAVQWGGSRGWEGYPLGPYEGQSVMSALDDIRHDWDIGLRVDPKNGGEDGAQIAPMRVLQHPNVAKLWHQGNPCNKQVHFRMRIIFSLHR